MNAKRLSWTHTQPESTENSPGFPPHSKSNRRKKTTREELVELGHRSSVNHDISRRFLNLRGIGKHLFLPVGSQLFSLQIIIWEASGRWALPLSEGVHHVHHDGGDLERVLVGQHELLAR